MANIISRLAGRAQTNSLQSIQRKELEAQMLSTAVRSHGYVGTDVYKATHANHPCNVWARQSKGNFLWLLDHADALLCEYAKRFNKFHASTDVIVRLEDFFPMIPPGGQTDFANCAANASLGIDFKSEPDVIEAYKKYLTIRWDNDKRPPTWYGKQERPW